MSLADSPYEAKHARLFELLEQAPLVTPFRRRDFR